MKLYKTRIAVSVAQILASANRKAKELGIDVKESLITARATFGEKRLAVACACAGREITSGGAAAILLIDIDPTSADIKQILRGQ